MRLACAIGVGCLAATHRIDAAPAGQHQQIALIAKPAVMRVWGAYTAEFEFGGLRFKESIGGSGTGFFITADGYIATNAHVVASIHGGEARAKEALHAALHAEIDRKFGNQLLKVTKAQLTALYNGIRLIELKKLGYVVLPNGDHLDYQVVQIGAAGTGRDCAIIKVATAGAPALPIGDSSRSQVEDHIVVLGYPGVADFESLLDEKSQLEASVTDGAISSLKRAASGEPILQISAPITHGNSGGPAIDQRGDVIGLATFGNLGEVQGFNFLVASATLLALVKDAKLQLAPSPTTEAWRRGLEHYWADEYTQAIARFDEVEAAFAAHSEAANLIRLSRQAQKDGKEKQPDNRAGLAAAAVIGGIAVIGAALVITLRARRRPGHPVPAVPAIPATPRPQLPMYGRIQSPSTAQPAEPPPPMHGRPAATPNQPIAPTAFGSLSVGSVTCTRGELAGQRFALTATGLIIGRQPGVAHVLVNDHRASGKHVWIGLDNGILVAVDQNTTNGTYVNDVARGRITRTALRDGDVVIVGEPDCLSLQVKLG
ncbi:MAG TPA: trypsin-like peptidase domain-containing protein [Kofleriaceae bacterium]|nr:trypsin-like peptidase domain-containing protein [Kofleriaceae bacterium]